MGIEEILKLAEQAGFRIPDDEQGKVLLTSRLILFAVLFERAQDREGLTTD